MMRYVWRVGAHVVTEQELAEWTVKHAHEFYETANRFLVAEADGYEGRGGTESVYREDAFSTAAEFYRLDYDTLYNAWLDKVPINWHTFIAH